MNPRFLVPSLMGMYSPSLLFERKRKQASPKISAYKKKRKKLEKQGRRNARKGRKK